MDSKTIEFWYTILLFGSFIVMAIAWITFARLSMARIEGEVKKTGIRIHFSGTVWVGGFFSIPSQLFFLKVKLSASIDLLMFLWSEVMPITKIGFEVWFS